MRRKLFWATTVAVVCCVGGTRASQVKPERVGQEGADQSTISSIPDDVARFLSNRSDEPSAFAVLTRPLDVALPPQIASARPQSAGPRVMIEQTHPTSAELPLVPLPAPVFTGGAGLLALGFVGLCKKMHKRLRYPHPYSN